MTMPIRVLLADDHPALRAGVRAALEAPGDIQVVGEADDGRSLPQLCQELSPHVLVLDLQMPGPGPFATVTAIQGICPAVKIVILTAYDEDVYIRGAMAVGVAAYIRKDEDTASIVAAVRTAANGGLWLSHSIATKVAQWATDMRPVTPIRLSDQELVVLRLLVDGLMNSEIGRALGVSEKAVEKRMSEICRKLGVTTRVAAAVRAVRDNLV